MLLVGTMETRACKSCGSTIARIAGRCGKCGRSVFGDNPALWGVFAGLALLGALEALALAGCQLSWLEGP